MPQSHIEPRSENAEILRSDLIATNANSISNQVNDSERNLIDNNSGLAKYKITNHDLINLHKEDEECTICLDYIMTNTQENFPLKISCNHFFHYRCLNGLLIVNNKCPNCRNRIEI